jgi:hypothetical protein
MIHKRTLTCASGTPYALAGACTVTETGRSTSTAGPGDVGLASNVGTGTRTISQTGDVYLYKTFACSFAIRVWTPARLRAAHQRRAEECPSRECFYGGNSFLDAAATRAPGGRAER